MPEFLDRGPFAVPLVRRLPDVLVVVVVGVTLRSVEAMIEVSLTVVCDIEGVKVVVLEVVLSCAVKPRLGRRWKPECLD